MPNLQNLTEKITKNISKVIVGKESTIEMLMVALLSEGHVLIEDVPGVGKTMLARALAISLGGEFKRVQCTPDLLPNDISGVSIFNQAKQDFEFRPGPVFVNILLADEINRATPRTQSALLEAMQEVQVTTDGTTYPLPRPFLVMATQNPIEYEGTFPLPEAQLDRFMLKVDMGYPTSEEEKQIVQRVNQQHPIESLKPVTTPENIMALRPQIAEIHVDETVLDYMVRLVIATRTHGEVILGASPRATIALHKSCQSLAALQGRDHVLPDDVKQMARYVLAHRLILKPQAELRGRTSADVVQQIIDNTQLYLKKQED